MSIHVRCPHCGKRLRAKDSAAGKEIDCPACGHPMRIPEPEEAIPPEPRHPGPTDQEFNPFAAPQSTGSADWPFDDHAERTGPPWERDEPFGERFFATVKGVLFHPTELFLDMRREGGLGKPMAFCVLGGWVGTVAAACYQLAFTLMVDQGRPRGAGAVESVGGVLCLSLAAPIILLVGLFLSAGIMHLSLMVLGGARFPFETTFRVAAYAQGATALLNLIPFCGYVAGVIWAIVAEINGLANAHEISTGKAAAAVFLPLIFCCGAVVLASVVAIALIGAMAAAA